MSDRVRVRHLLDHLNHDDLIGEPGLPEAPADSRAFGRRNEAWVPVLEVGQGMPEAPVTGQTFGRGGLGWYPVLPLAGGQLAGPLITDSGRSTAPGLMLGSNDTGFYRSGTSVWFTLGFTEMLGFLTNLIAMFAPLNMGNNPIKALADPTADTDALNLGTADARYWAKTDQGAPVGAWQDFEVQQGWTGNTLRFRLIDSGTSLQLEGNVNGAMPAGSMATLGAMPPGYQPVRDQTVVAGSFNGITAGAASLSIRGADAGGVVNIFNHAAALTALQICVTVPLT